MESQSLDQSCKNDSCQNHGIGALSNPNEYHRFGSTASGSNRYRCKSCRHTFSVTSNPTHRQRFPEKNAKIFKALMQGKSVRQICREVSINPSGFYNKIDFIRKQCLKFESMNGGKLDNNPRWLAANKYSTEVNEKIADINRVYYNYIGIGDISPAREAGLTKRKVTMSDILNIL